MRTLIFIPTFNERDNAPRMCREINDLKLDADVLFADDGSPDGTGELLEALKAEFPRLIVHHRPGKMGIGNAHSQGIQWAYQAGYELMITLDCDFTHSPSNIPSLIHSSREFEITIGSRWLRKDSLPGWNPFRRLMTNLGHLLTRIVLGVKQDASGAFRAYRLDLLPKQVFDLIKSKGYAFFFESLFIFNRNGFSITEVPIVLPARTYGNSKMTTKAAIMSGLHIFELFLASLKRPEQFLVSRVLPKIDPRLIDPQDWDNYWSKSGDRPESAYEGSKYELIAGLYRRGIIKRNLERVIREVFSPQAALLHAGCGGGQVDYDLHQSMRISALDISAGALRLYSLNNPAAFEIRHGSIFELPFEANSFDGVYNLGVMEHFTAEQIGRILREFHRVLRPSGKVVAFWPHFHGTSVYTFRAIHYLLDRISKSETRLHPAELTLMHSRSMAGELFEAAGFKIVGYRFGVQDFFVQAEIVAERVNQ